MPSDFVSLSAGAQSESGGALCATPHCWVLSIASPLPSTLTRIGALPVQLTVTLAQRGSRFGALVGAALRLLVAESARGVLLVALAVSPEGAPTAVRVALTVAVMVLDTST
jgi:hypothetical protein